MENQQWTKIIIEFKNKVNPAVIDTVNDVLFNLETLGTEVINAPDYYTNQPNLFGEIPAKLSEEELNKAPSIISYFEETPSLDDLRELILSRIPDLEFEIIQDVIYDQNWNENWMDYYEIEKLSRFIKIVPEWIDYIPQSDERIIQLNPGLSFGTGNHPTTKLGGQALELFMDGGEVVLDVGCGSGVLSFIAASLGASSVNGYDLDPQAVSSAQSNLQLQTDPNITTLREAGKINFSVNDLLKGIDTKADIIIANILPHILVNLFTDATRLLNKGGLLILGGILEEKATEIESALNKHDYEIIQKTHLGEWVGYVTKRKGDD